MPALTPVTTPEVPTIATTGVELDHMPPDGVDESEVIPLTQTRLLPVMGEGFVFTDTDLQVLQPVESV